MPTAPARMTADWLTSQTVREDKEIFCQSVTAHLTLVRVELSSSSPPPLSKRVLQRRCQSPGLDENRVLWREFRRFLRYKMRFFFFLLFHLRFFFCVSQPVSCSRLLSTKSVTVFTQFQSLLTPMVFQATQSFHWRE